ncbi:MAG: ATP-binding protein [Chloroflexota bacterium]
MTGTEATTDFEELRQMIVRLARLVEISVTLNSTLEPDRLLQFIIRSAADLLESEAASILLVDENTHNLYFAATGSDPKELAKVPVPLEGSIAGMIFREDKPLIINEVATDQRHFREVGERIHFQTRSLVGVPMRIRERVTGVLEAVNKRHGAFTEADVQTLSIIASQAAVALHNARLVDALQRAYDELGKLDRLKSDFIAIASHELRTPLGVILGYATILKEEADAASSEHATAVLNSALRMRSLIEDMTNMNLLQFGTAEVSLVLQPLAPIARAAYEEVSELVRAKGQSLALRLPEEPLQAMVDSAKLGMALTNLLNNAMRFTPTEGHIWLDVERRGTEAWLRVRDDGPGVPSEELEKIFDRFYQVEEHMRRRHGGMGLGLAIVRAIAKAHGGRAWAESAGPGQGATFTIAIPLRG